MVLLDTGTPGTSRENFSEDADDGTRTFLSCIAQWLEHSVCNRGVASSGPIIGDKKFILNGAVKSLNKFCYQPVHLTCIKFTINYI